ncbi:MAG: peptidoglycan DD-metalloendopeptidase family protein, partial [Anaerolineae bacterium]|nr:peptidoglycan DD-metalloendopeptidase family protein [Anaerolineae bacterium]
GVVIFQGDLRVWGNVTVIRHDPLRAADGPIYYSRYGHMQNVVVKVGDRVKRGQKIGEVGKGFGNFAAHLHFDIVRTTALERYAGDWPGMDLARLERDYVDPLEFIRSNRPKR